MARYEGKLTPAGEARPSVRELVATMEAEGRSEDERQRAIACYLSASEGWRDAVQRLGGAFAAQGLRADKEP